MRILILKLGAIGDVVMASSLITAIEEKYPKAEITWICGRIVEPILASFERIDKIFVVDEYKFYHGSFFEKLGVVFSVWKFLFGKRFQIVLNCYRDRRYKIFFFPVRSDVYKDLSNKSSEKYLLPGRYHADEYSRMITGNKNESSKFPKVSLHTKLNISDLFKDITSSKIVLAPGGSKNVLRQDDLRRWPIENYVELANELVARKYAVILVGSEDDKWVLQKFDGIKFINLIGKTNLLDLIQLFNNSDILITHDTGIFHLAKLSKIKIIGLFGPVDPKERVGANENVEVIWGGSLNQCAPCYNGKTFADCNDNLCMKNISTKDVLQKIDGICN